MKTIYFNALKYQTGSKYLMDKHILEPVSDVDKRLITGLALTGIANQIGWQRGREEYCRVQWSQYTGDGIGRVVIRLQDDDGNEEDYDVRWNVDENGSVEAIDRLPDSRNEAAVWIMEKRKEKVLV